MTRIEPGKGILSRVEGHGFVELVKNKAEAAEIKLHLTETPRLFEKMLIGKNYQQIPDIVCRICSICSTSHRIASIACIESAFGIKVSQETAYIRRATYLGGMIESHALHLGTLLLPDYNQAKAFTDLSEEHTEIFRATLELKKLGNLIQEICGGRAIHPFNLLIGRTGSFPESLTLDKLKEYIKAAAPLKEKIARCYKSLKPVIPAVSSPAPLSAEDSGDSLITGNGKKVESKNAVNWLSEEKVPYSNALFCRFNSRTPYMTGALARQILAGRIPASADISNTPAARIIEISIALDEAFAIMEKLSLQNISESCIEMKPAESTGISIIEAPRGTLIHRYDFDRHGICTGAKVITPTAINQWAIQAALSELAEKCGSEEISGLRLKAEHLVRLFDPCISCAVH